MEPQNVWQLVATEFRKAKIPFLVVGGFAVNHYGVSRSTADFDLLITDESYPQALQILKKGGYQEFRKESMCARLKSDRLFFMPVDLLFTDPRTLLEMVKEAKTVSLRGAAFGVPSLNHLMAMKLHALKEGDGSREYKDLIDLLDLAKANQVRLTSKAFEELCLKYGGPKVYKRIKEFSP